MYKLSAIASVSWVVSEKSNIYSTVGLKIILNTEPSYKFSTSSKKSKTPAVKLRNVLVLLTNNNCSDS